MVSIRRRLGEVKNLFNVVLRMNSLDSSLHNAINQEHKPSKELYSSRGKYRF